MLSGDSLLNEIELVRYEIEQLSDLIFKLHKNKRETLIINIIFSFEIPCRVKKSHNYELSTSIT
jgi:hypothetical protein